MWAASASIHETGAVKEGPFSSAPSATRPSGWPGRTPYPSGTKGGCRRSNAPCARMCGGAARPRTAPCSRPPMAHTIGLSTRHTGRVNAGPGVEVGPNWCQPPAERRACRSWVATPPGVPSHHRPFAGLPGSGAPARPTGGSPAGSGSTACPDHPALGPHAARRECVPAGHPAG